MPPTLKVNKKRKKGKGKRKGKKKKKVPAVINPPPLHHLTELYNELREKVFDLQRTQVTARKKRLEGWYMTREMLNLKHDNEVYHDYLKEKMEDIEKLIKDINAQLEKEREEVERLIRERMAEYDRKIGEMRSRMTKGEIELSELKMKLLEFEPLMKKFLALLARLKELEDQLPAAELEANIKTRHLKNQYLNERAKLYNHLEEELYKLITTCRTHLMPILADHMHYMELENRCNRWDLSRLDITNFKMSQQKELLLEKRNRLNMERGYLSLDWAFNKLAQAEVKKKERLEQSRKLNRTSTTEEDCELAVVFKQYLNKRLLEERRRKAKEARIQRKREEKQRLLAIEEEKERKEAAEQAAERAKEMGEMEEEGEDWEHSEDEYEGASEDELEEMEYYEDEFGNLVLASSSRMKQHKAIMENKSLNDMGDEDSDEDEDKDDLDDDGDGIKGSGSNSSSTLSSGSSWNSDDAVTINGDQEDYGQGDDDIDDHDGAVAEPIEKASLATGMSSVMSSKPVVSAAGKHNKVKPLKPKAPAKKK